jgi:hypothetical protein
LLIALLRQGGEWRIQNFDVSGWIRALAGQSSASAITDE